MKEFPAENRARWWEAEEPWLCTGEAPTWRHTHTHTHTHTLTTPRPPLRSVVPPTRPHFPFWIQPKPFRKAYNVLNLAASAPQPVPTACLV